MNNCIFCGQQIDPMTVPPEHIIPSSIEGSVVTYNVCDKCNKMLGTEVDSELNQHRHIWDIRKRHKQLPPLKSVFQMQKKFATLSDGSEMPIVPRSDSDRIMTHKLSDGGIQADRRIPPRQDPFLQWLDKERKKVGMSNKSFNEHHVQRYLDARKKGSYLGKFVYRDWLFTGMDVFFGEEKAAKVASIMSASIPRRFIAKACVEYAYLFGWENEITNINDLKKIAHCGDFEQNGLEFGADLCKEKNTFPCHTISFDDKWFSLGIYNVYFIGVGIRWRDKSKHFICIDDFIARKLRICHESDSAATFNIDESFDFKDHKALGRSTHV
ncbi:MAG: HNH endonuclease [Chitinivibrionales bacterium]